MIACTNCREMFIPADEDEDTCPECQEIIRQCDAYEDRQLAEIEAKKLEYFYGGGMIGIADQPPRTTCCGNCGNPRTVEDGYVLECANCGDDEYEIATAAEAGP